MKPFRDFAEKFDLLSKYRNGQPRDVLWIGRIMAARLLTVLVKRVDVGVVFAINISLAS